MCRIKLFLCFCVFSFFFFDVTAQEEKKATPLKLILERISIMHDVKFSYADDEIVVYNLVPPDEALPLPAKIDYIKSETKLSIKVIANKYYTIFNDQKMDKPLCGFIIDKETGLPVADVIVTILKLNITVMSDASGYFELPVISPDYILLRHLNYKPQEIEPSKLYSTDCVRIEFIPEIQILDEVQTQRYLATGISKSNTGSIVVKPRKFGILPGLTESDVLQAMQQIPGIYSVDESISNINVRGGTHDQNLFLWNGIRMFQTGHFFGLISAFNPSLSHSISITKNGTSAFYGESVSSLVDMSARSNTIEDTQGSFSANMISAEFYSKIKISRSADLEISGRRSFTDVISSPTYKNYRNKIFQNTIVTDLASNQRQDYKIDEDFYFYDFSIQYQQKIGTRHTLALNGIAIRNELVLNQESSLANRRSDLGQQDYGGTVAWKTNWSDKQTSDANYYISYYNLDATNSSVISDQVLDQRNSVMNMGFRLKNANQISKTINLSYGYQFDALAVGSKDLINSPSFSRVVKDALHTHTLVAEANYQSNNKKTSFRGGVRTNYFEEFDIINPEVRLHFNHALTPELNIEIQSEQKSQTLSQVIDLQQDFLGIEKRRWTLSDDQNVPIQKSNQFSTGITYKNKNWLVSTDHFYKIVDGITTGSQGFQNQFEFIKSAGSYEVWGTEILVQKSFRRFYTWFSYSFNDNKYKFNNITSSQFPNNFELSHIISWAGIYEWNKIKVALGGKWHSGRPITIPISNIAQNLDSQDLQIAYHSPNNENLNQFFQFNFSASKEWNVNRKVLLQTSISVLNLLNKKNILSRSYRINPLNNAIEKVDIYSLGSTPNISLRLIF